MKRMLVVGMAVLFVGMASLAWTPPADPMDIVMGVREAFSIETQSFITLTNFGHLQLFLDNRQMTNLHAWLSDNGDIRYIEDLEEVRYIGPSATRTILVFFDLQEKPDDEDSS